MQRIKCSICNSNIEHIYKIDNIPNQLSCVNEPNLEISTLSISQCVECNTIQLDKLIPLEILYKNSHNHNSIGNLWNNYFELFIKKIQNIINNKTVLEIGCPSGKIALKSNYYKHWYIVEPNKNPDVIFKENITFIEKFFNDDLSLNEKIDVIIHSHLFEHIYEPNIFLSKCNKILNDNGDMFFGVPNMEYFIKTNTCPFLGLFFEHTIFLNKENISYLLNKNNFEIIDIIDYENHSILFHCKKRSFLQKINNSFFIPKYNDSFFMTLKYYETFIKKCNDSIRKTNKNVYIFSASYITQIILAIGLNAGKLNGILDNCKEKEGKYLFGYNLKIFNPSILSNEDSIVILKNGYYANEVLLQIKDINSHTEIIM